MSIQADILAEFLNPANPLMRRRKPNIKAALVRKGILFSPRVFEDAFRDLEARGFIVVAPSCSIPVCYVLNLGQLKADTALLTTVMSRANPAWLQARGLDPTQYIQVRFTSTPSEVVSASVAPPIERTPIFPLGEEV